MDFTSFIFLINLLYLVSPFLSTIRQDKALNNVKKITPFIQKFEISILINNVARKLNFRDTNGHVIKFSSS